MEYSQIFGIWDELFPLFFISLVHHVFAPFNCCEIIATILMQSAVRLSDDGQGKKKKKLDSLHFFHTNSHT